MSSELVFVSVSLLIVFSAICSGLNVALMSIDLVDLKRQRKSGNKNARKIFKYRKNAHLSLASILIANVAFASAAAIILGGKFNGLLAAAMSTILLVIFSELLPQALFTRNALSICVKFIPLLKLFIFFTYPLAKPLQIALDQLFGPTSDKRLHTRGELGVLINEHLAEPSSELDDDEVEIIRGALQLSEKHVESIMTPIKMVFWIDKFAVIDGDMIDRIKAAGYSRIPIFDKKLKQCFGVLLMKDLVDIDFDTNAQEISKIKLHKTEPIGGKTALDTMFRHFISAKTHLMPVTNKGKIVGVVTIEDLIEEIIGHEITDESDRSIIHTSGKIRGS